MEKDDWALIQRVLSLRSFRAFEPWWARISEEILSRLLTLNLPINCHLLGMLPQWSKQDGKVGLGWTSSLINEGPGVTEKESDNG